MKNVFIVSSMHYLQEWTFSYNARRGNAIKNYEIKNVRSVMSSKVFYTFAPFRIFLMWSLSKWKYIRNKFNSENEVAPINISLFQNWFMQNNQSIWKGLLRRSYFSSDIGSYRYVLTSGDYSIEIIFIYLKYLKLYGNKIRKRLTFKRSLILKGFFLLSPLLLHGSTFFANSSRSSFLECIQYMFPLWITRCLKWVRTLSTPVKRNS